MTTAAEATIGGLIGMLVGGTTLAFAEDIISFATIDQGQITMLAVLFGVIATGLTGISTALANVLVKTVRELKQITATSDSGKLQECKESMEQLQQQFDGVYKTMEAFREISETRLADVVSMKAAYDGKVMELKQKEQEWKEERKTNQLTIQQAQQNSAALVQKLPSLSESQVITSPEGSDQNRECS